MPYFSEQVDALLRVFFSSPTWHIDRPRENARFYRFAAAMMQEVGQPDIREVRATLDEAAHAWAADYETEVGGARVAALCERLRVLYDFFGALQGELPPTSPRDDSPPPSPRVPMTPGTSPPRQKPPSAPAPSSPAGQGGLVRGPTPSQDGDVPLQPPTVRKARPKRGAQVEPQEAGKGPTPSDPALAPWQHFWPEVIRLHDLLLQRRGEPPPPTIPSHDPEAIGAEMRRWMGEVLRAEEITGAEKRNLVGRVISKVTLAPKDVEGVSVTIEWQQ